MGALANLLKQGVLELGNASSGHNCGVSRETPNLDDCLTEVSIFLPWEDTILVHVVIDEAVTVHVIVGDIITDTIFEFSGDRLRRLLARGDTRVFSSSERTPELIH
jgi:hypothetical protein